MNCAIETIDIYVPSIDLPWNEKRVNHLFRRLGFGANLTAFSNLLNSADPALQISGFLNDAANSPNQIPPFWANYTLNDFDSIDEMEQLAFDFVRDWILKMQTDGIKEKMILFWKNHFVTKLNVYEFGPFMYQYYATLESFAFGNFKDFVKEIGLSAAMLIYLNGDENTSANPNENYARELYELFTLGADNNYTQNDIEETARAFTGYYINPYSFQVALNPLYYDNADKTIFGQTANYNYNAVIDLLFAERSIEIATFICTKIYKHFVSPNVVDEIITELVQTFLDNDFELLPVYEQLFTSKHFFDEANICGLIKSPIDVLSSFAKEINFDLNSEIDGSADLTFAIVFPFSLANQGQALFNPIDVAGWQGNRDWLNSDSLTKRWDALDNITAYCTINQPELLVDFASELANNSNDPLEITTAIINHFIPNGLQTLAEYNNATTIFKWEVPQNYFDDGTWNLSWEESKYQIAVLIQHIARLPEFQLF